MLSKDIIDIQSQYSDTSIFFWPPSEGDFQQDRNFQFISNSNSPVIKTFNNFFIGSSSTVTTSTGCKGLYLNILGDCIIDGSLSMTGKSVGGASPYVGIDTRYGIFYNNNKSILINRYNILDDNIISNNSSGTRFTGFGGSGANGGASGAPGTAFAGGSGGGGWGGGYDISRYESPGIANAGRGGNGRIARNGYNRYVYGGAGAGHPAGSGEGSAGSGAGGLIILIVHGKLKINLNGSIASNGLDGGLGWYTGGDYTGSPNAYNMGGGTGGGCINIFCNKDKLIKYGTITAAGGISNGGTGSITISTL